MARWYFSVDGRAEGPVDAAAIIESLRSGQLTDVDLVFREGDDQWRAVGDVAEFQSAVPRVTLPPNPVESDSRQTFSQQSKDPVGRDQDLSNEHLRTTVDTPVDVETEPSLSSATVVDIPSSRDDAKDIVAERSKSSDTSAPRAPRLPPMIEGDSSFRFHDVPSLTWVLLKKVESTGGEDRFLQNGPFSLEQLTEMLASGEARYSDYVWRPGYRRWARLGNLPEFDRRIKIREGDGDTQVNFVPMPQAEIVDSEPSREELLSHVLRGAKAPSAMAQPESRPEEAWGPDLAEPSEAAVRTSVTPMLKPEKPVHSAALAEKLPGLAASDDERTVVYGADGKTAVFHQVAMSSSPAGNSNLDAKTVIYNLDGKTPGLTPPGEDPERTIIHQKPQMDHSQQVRSSKEISHAPPASTHRRRGTSANLDAVASDEGEIMLEPAGQKRRWYRPVLIAMAAIAVVVVGLQTIDRRNRDQDDENPVTARNQSSSKAGVDSEEAPTTVPVGRPNGTSMAGPDVVGGEDGRPSQAQTPPGTTPSKKPSTATTSPTNSLTAAAQAAAAQANPSISTEEISPTSGGKVGSVDGTQGVSGLKVIPPAIEKTTVVDIVPVRTDSVKPQFAIQTDAPVGETIWFSIRARTGDILRLPSYTATLSSKRVGGEIPTFDLTSLRLPPGTYRIDVSIGEIRRAKTVFVGTKNEFFQAELEKHLKQLAYQQQQEKKALVRSAARLEVLAKALGEQYFKLRSDTRKWRAYYAGWQKSLRQTRQILVDGVRAERRNELAFPDEMLALKDASIRLGDQAQMLNDSILTNSQARDVAGGGGNLAIVKEFTRLRAQAGAISARR